jgi:hypothetical protein
LRTQYIVPPALHAPGKTRDRWGSEVVKVWPVLNPRASAAAATKTL